MQGQCAQFCHNCHNRRFMERDGHLAWEDAITHWCWQHQPSERQQFYGLTAQQRRSFQSWDRERKKLKNR